MSKKRILIVTFILACQSLLGICQKKSDEGFQSLTDDLQKFYVEYPQENGLIVTDNSVYVNGEFIFIKVFLWNNQDRSYRLSGNGYLVLRDEYGKVFSIKQVLLVKGQGNTEMAIPDKIKPGLYNLEFFTSWMLNFSGSPIHSKLLWIGEENTSVTAYFANRPDPFMRVETNSSEGDSIIIRLAVYAGQDIQSDFSVQFTDAHGKVVLTKHFNESIAVFEVHLPEAGKYDAQICLTDGGCHTRKIEVKQSPGLQIEMSDNDSLAISLKGVPLNKGQYLIAVTTKDQCLLARKIYDDEGRNTIVLPLVNIHAASVEVVLFDADKNILDKKEIYLPGKTQRNYIVSEQRDLQTGYTRSTLLISSSSKNLIAPEAALGFVRSQDYAADVVHVSELKLLDGNLLNLSMFNTPRPFLKALQYQELKYLKENAPVIGKESLFRRELAMLTMRNPDPIEFFLSGLHLHDKVDSIVQLKSKLRRIQETYHSNTEIKFEHIPSDKQFFTADYPSLNTVGDLFQNLIQNLRIRLINQAPELRLLYVDRNGNKLFYPNKPEIQVDYKPVNDIKNLLDQPITNFSKVEVLYNPKTLFENNLSSFFPNGLIALHSNGEPNNRVENVSEFFPVDYNETLQQTLPTNAQLPFFNLLKCWYPKLLVKEDVTRIAFNLSAYPGKCHFYLVTMEGVRNGASFRCSLQN